MKKVNKIWYEINEFYEKWDIDINPSSNNDVLVVIREHEVIKVMQDGNNIMT